MMWLRHEDQNDIQSKLSSRDVGCSPPPPVELRCWPFWSDRMKFERWRPTCNSRLSGNAIQHQLRDHQYIHRRYKISRWLNLAVELWHFLWSEFLLWCPNCSGKNGQIRSLFSQYLYQFSLQNTSRHLQLRNFSDMDIFWFVFYSRICGSGYEIFR